MATISVRTALGAGFRLIRREPLAFLAWCVAYFFVGVLPQLVMLDALIPFMEAFRASSGDASDPAVVAAVERMGHYYLLYGLSVFVSATVIPGAVFRAVLTPQDRRAFFLRVGAGEGWLGLSLLALAGLTMLGFIVLSLPAGLIAAFAAPLAPLAMAAVLATLIWGLLRLSFAPVMGFADHGFRLAQSWRATPPLMGRLLLAAGGLFVLVLAGYMLTGMAAAGFAPAPGPTSWARRPGPTCTASSAPSRPPVAADQSSPRITRANRSGSTLPPDSTTPSGPPLSNLPASRAARAAAPLGSRTSFRVANAKRMASATSRSLTVATAAPARCRMGKVISPGNGLSSASQSERPPGVRVTRSPLCKDARRSSKPSGSTPTCTPRSRPVTAS